MSRISTFRQRVIGQETLAGTFLKTPHYNLVEVFAQSGFDFLCLDAEHAPFDRAVIDQCLAVACALDFPVLIRVGDHSARAILWALDCGAVGVVVPHVDSVQVAQDVAKSARFGLGGRGYAGSSRWGEFATKSMPDLLEKSQRETVVIAQIEEPYAVPLASEIAAIDGIDALFSGPADLSVGMGYDHQNSPELHAALKSIGDAAKAYGKGYASFVPNAQVGRDWAEKYGVTMFYVGSEHGFMRSAANAIADALKAD